MTDNLSAWVQDEQHILWGDLLAAIQAAQNGVWSIQAANIARRIVEAARLVGPTELEGVPWTLSAGGVYEAVLTAGGMPPIVMPDEQEWERLDVIMTPFSGTRAAAVTAMAATVAVINTDRERAWIDGQG